MKIIDNFLQEDMLITKPSVYIYVNKDNCNDLINRGIQLDKDYISCYLTRLPEDNIEYKDFISKVNPVRITLSKLNRIKDQKVTLKPVNISSLETNEIKLKDDSIITKLQRKYSSYLNTCYKDRIPLENLPRIDLYLEKRFLPGFVCKILHK